MNVQTFLENFIYSIQAKEEKFKRDQYKARYRALRRRELTRIKHAKFIIALKLALRFYWRVFIIAIFLNLVYKNNNTDSYKFDPPNAKALELYSTNEEAFVHVTNLIEIIKFCIDNDLITPAILARLTLDELLSASD